MTQKEAVFQAVSSVLASSGLTLSPSTPASDLLNRELRALVNSIIVGQLQNGTVAISGDSSVNISDNSQVRAYVSGLVSNWLRKDSRLNGGSTTTTKSKTSKKVNDPQLKALKVLLKAETDSAKRNEISAHISNREKELSSSATL